MLPTLHGSRRKMIKKTRINHHLGEEIDNMQAIIEANTEEIKIIEMKASTGSTIIKEIGIETTTITITIIMEAQQTDPDRAIEDTIITSISGRKEDTK